MAVSTIFKLIFLVSGYSSAIEVYKMETNKLVHTISVPNTPHSMGYDTELNKLLVADESQIEIYDGTSYKLLATIPTEAHADASVYDPINELFYVGNSGRQANRDYCLITIVDARNNKVVGDIKVDSDHIEQ
jgi:DNA-binding beta-propeller fold protein YncE